MNAGKRVSRRVLDVLRRTLPVRTAVRSVLTQPEGRPRPENICLSCRFQLRVRSRQASTAAAVAETSHPPSSKSAGRESAPPAPVQTYRVVTAVIVSRPPLITRDAHPFERAYHLYNRRLNERLALPFTRYFYYKKGTPLDAEWKRKVRARNTVARDVGSYNAYAKDGWNDEVLVGDRTGEWESVVSEVYRDAEDFTDDAAKGKTGAMLGEGEAGGSKAEDASIPSKLSSLQPGEAKKITGTGSSTNGTSATSNAADASPFDLFATNTAATQEAGSTGEVVKASIPRPAPRVTQADQTNDVKSLNRKMDRTLYLLVKNGLGRWEFPGAAVEGREALSQAAERVLIQAGGMNLNTWVVGNAPVAWRQSDLKEPVAIDGGKRVQLGDKTFFMKVRAMTGQLDISRNVLGDTDFRWLAKEEVQGIVHPSYWSSVKNALVEQ